MARVQAFFSFDQTDLNFHNIFWGDSSFYNNQYLALAGRSYEDFQITETYGGGAYYLDVIAGHGMRANGWGEVTSGTITGVFEAFSTDGVNYYDYFYLTGISISAADYYRAFSTSGTQDDDALIARAFAGNDRFELSNYQDRAQGHGGNDVMYGYGGNDTLEGGQGNDQMFGGSGADRLVGGTGIDRLTGGSGADVFVFARTTDLGLSSAATDTITDFTRGQDRINLSAIDAMPGAAGNQAFQFNGRAAITTSGRGEVSVQTYDRAGTANDMTLVRIDIDGDRDAEALIRLSGLHNLSASDFIL